MYKDFRLIQEDYLDDPWKILVCCILLNRATSSTAKPVIEKIFKVWPTPNALMEANSASLYRTIERLGFGEKRMVYIKHMSRQYLQRPNIEDVTEFFGCGPYAQDCWELLVLKKKPSRMVRDKELRKYMVREGML